ncbi:hypothetical protein H6P81_009368 [Aristolochia fimbriata]|uniref:Photosystem II 5 kDa protein, chloroplastic n=1 Tax=Aristolochia fimbriata TaxID=158543 RepID=A0AAV7EQ61_ARIFI|nr:hypothetical protein H6P81_009368 [Aristolochia fimbriata]
MASITMTSSLVGGISAAGRTSVNNRRQVVMAKAAAVSVEGASSDQGNGESRRNLMFAAAAAAVCSAAAGCGDAVALADEPKRGSPEAKKKYAPICVTMPTARICRN